MALFHSSDVVYFILGGALLAGACAYLAATWRDSLTAAREFLIPLRTLRRPRFGMIHLFVALVIAAVVAKLATRWNWTSSTWITNVGLMASLALAISAVAFFLWICWRDLVGRRPKSSSQTKVQLPREEAMGSPVKKSKPRIRFPEIQRQTTGFKR